RGAVRRDLTKPPPAPEPPVVAAPTQLSAELAAAVPVVEAAAVAAAPLKSAAIQLPSHPDVVTCLKQLLGADAGLRAESVPLPSDLDAFYVARLVDSADQEVGAILLDLRAGAELGGRLLGLPAAAVEEQAKSEPSSDVLDSMNEVVNNLGGFVNRANPELRVRVRPLEKPGSAAPDWLGQPSARGGSATPSGGRLWLVAR
ncbi:MAG TPA: hypothetical protein VEQ58_11810, partial [Polyangiaceae bacterium]|nr:hypothetical protein [Polyangiaceae bacterium]